MKTQTTVTYPPPDTGSTLIQVSGALTLIILLILAVGWLAKRFGLVARHTTVKGITVIASVSLGTRERVVVVAVENARLVLGVTSQQITCLHTLPPDNTGTDADPPNIPHVKPTTGFSSLLAQILRRNRSQ